MQKLRSFAYSNCK